MLCIGKPGSGAYGGYPAGRVVGGGALYIAVGAGAGNGCVTVFGTCSLFWHLTTIMTATTTAAMDPRTIPAMAPPDRPPLSPPSSSSGLLVFVGLLPLPGALVPIE